MSTIVRSFAELTPYELHAILKLRAGIFILEQGCQYLDPDTYDLQALHVWEEEQDGVIAYLRILPPHTKGAESYIGRVCVRKEHRGSGIGSRVFSKALDLIAVRWPDCSVHVEAQAHLEEYYQRFGFYSVGVPYDDAGIQHIRMRRDAARDVSSQGGFYFKW